MKKLSLLLVVLVVLQMAAFAASANSATVKFDQSVTVGSSTLRAGEYKVTWTQTGSDSKVTFSQRGKEVAVVPATVVDQKNPDIRVLTATAGSGKELTGIDLKNATLTFGSTSAVGK
jgi:hypothetical protein